MNKIKVPESILNNKEVIESKSLDEAIRECDKKIEILNQFKLYDLFIGFVALKAVLIGIKNSLINH